MISEAEALDRIFATHAPLPGSLRPLGQVAGHYAAEAISSPVSLPRFDQSAMDGYALRAAETPGDFRVVGEQPAGATRHLRTGPGEAVRIFTGAPVPADADAVVMQEEVERTPSGIRIRGTTPTGEFIRRRGSDLCEGQQLIAAGELLTAPRIGLLSSAGIAEISVHRRPRAAIITTGDELRPAGTPLATGELYDSNTSMLAAQLTPFADLVGTLHSPDDPSALARAIRSFASADVVILSAGVSVGDHDPVHEALRQLSAAVDFWRVSIKPGKPFLMGALGDQKIFGLPGNPVSTFVTAQVLVIPALQRLAGAARPRPLQVRMPLGAPVANPDDRVHYLRATLRDGAIFPVGLQQSHALSGLARADFLIRIPSHSSCEAGAMVETLPLNFR